MKFVKKKIFFFSLPLLALLGCGYFVYNRYYQAPDLTIVGSVKMSDGLGRHPVELIQAFHRDMAIGVLHTANPCFIGVPKGVRGIIKKKYRKQGNILLSFDSVWTPTYSCIKHLKEEYAESQLRIAYSMFESSKIPPEWVTILNCYFDAVVVPDPYHLEVYKTSGVQTPIFVLPLVINLQNCLEKPLKKNCSTPFVFGNLSACIERKNQLLLIQAFHQAFGNSSDVLLKINSRYIQPEYAEKIQNYLDQNHISNVLVSNVCLDKHSYISFLIGLDSYVNISRGEGFSIQPREAMALGIPTIVSNNTAQTTIARSQLVSAIETPHKIPAVYDWNLSRSYGDWSTCSVDQVAAALLDMYNNYSSHLKQSEKAREWAMQYDFFHLKPLYKMLLRPTYVELGDENIITSEKIVTTSPTLLKKYQKLGAK